MLELPSEADALRLDVSTSIVAQIMIGESGPSYPGWFSQGDLRESAVGSGDHAMLC